MEEEKICPTKHLQNFIRENFVNFKSVLQQSNPLNTLNDIHNQFVVTLMRTSLFSTILCTYSLGLDHNNTGTNKTFITQTNYQTISGHSTFLRNKFNLVVDKENEKLPSIYWIP